MLRTLRATLCAAVALASSAVAGELCTVDVPAEDLTHERVSGVLSATASVVVGPSNRRAIVLHGRMAPGIRLQFFDDTTWVPRVSYDIPSGMVVRGAFVTWGSQGIAFRAGGAAPMFDPARIITFAGLAAAAEPPPSVIHIDAYFPLQQGTTWRYRKPNGREMRTKLLAKRKVVRGTNTWVAWDSDGQLREYYALDGAGLHLVKLSGRTHVRGIGVRRLSIVFDPPVHLCARVTDVEPPSSGRVHSSGRAIATLAGYPKLRVSFSAVFTIAAGGLIEVPAFEGHFQCVDLSGELTLDGDRIPLAMQLARGIGVVTTESDGEQAVLLSTNLGEHDLAIERVGVPARVTLTKKRPQRTAKIRIKVRNQGTRTEVITDHAMLDAFVRVQAESLGACPALSDARMVTKRLPIVIKPGRAKTIRMAVDVSCANDPARSSKKDPGHDDYRLVVTVDPTALDVFVSSDLTPPPAEEVQAEALLDVVQKQ